MNDLKNFSGFMPKGHLRPPFEPNPNKERTQLIASIDAHLEDIHFDTKRYETIHRKALVATKNLFAALKKDDEPLAELHERFAQRYRTLEENMQRPVYDAMIAQGYPRSVLIACKK